MENYENFKNTLSDFLTDLKKLSLNILPILINGI